jgi:hypothetical protein
MAPDLSDEEIAALTRLLREKIDNDRYPLSPRIQVLKGILAKFRPEPPREPSPPPPKVYAPPRASAETRRGIGARPAPGPPMTLGNAAMAGVRLIVWCKECRHQVEPDSAEQADRYGAETAGPGVARAEWLRGRDGCGTRRGPKPLRLVGKWQQPERNIALVRTSYKKT